MASLPYFSLPHPEPEEMWRHRTEQEAGVQKRNDFPGSYTGGGVDAPWGSLHLQLHAVSWGPSRSLPQHPSGLCKEAVVGMSHSEVTRSESSGVCTMPGPGVDGRAASGYF